MELARDLGRTWAWSLPADATCARTARRLVRDTLAELGVPEGAVDDAGLMVSELATNAHQHAAGHPPHELWVSCLDAFEFSCAIFDALPTRDLPLAFERGDFGRGLSIVAELSKGRWGTEVARARLDPRIRGKAIWFSCSR
ncbi:ATP-binding protein [Actinocorallia sp. API 0066]|uniref:ATP-binding protein n=1 Tax=Actinocorallia sp. API 0066 TaxID=2896846 RepID=UPI001E552E54|nr:ATP-binding protein [Actinocorallia sp. API 0066]MCD0452777.1 ATP-binding protein [Actinocorallia sp. API 0066]